MAQPLRIALIVFGAAFLLYGTGVYGLLLVYLGINPEWQALAFFLLVGLFLGLIAWQGKD